MKQKFAGFGLIIVLSLLVGCTSFQARETEKDVVGKIAARHLGAEFQKNYPEIAVKILALSKEVLATDEKETAASIVDNVVMALTDAIFDDPLLVMDVQDLVSLIEIKPDMDITEDHLKLVKSVAQGFISGLKQP